MFVLTAVFLSLGLIRCGSREEFNVEPFEPEVAKYYTVRIPEDYDPDEPYPLLIGLHGRGQDETQVTRMWDEGLFYMPDFILVSVRGPFRTSDGYCWIRYDSDTEPTKEVYVASALACEQLVFEVLEEVEQEYAVDPDFRTILGISEGASAAYFTALHEPEFFSGIADLGGRVPECLLPRISAQDAADLIVFIGMGKREPEPALNTARTRAEMLRRAGAEVQLNLHEEGHVLKARQVRAMENLFELGLGDAPVDDYMYDSDGEPETSSGL